MRLERLHLLNLFLDAINEDCDKFRQEWNAHPITGKAGGFSPNVMIFSTFGPY